MIDMQTLLAPVSAELPSGNDLSFSIEFDAIQEARRADDPSLDQGEWVTEIKEADWKVVRQRCIGLLTAKSKDLRLGMWLTEALTRTQGLPGLTQGLQLMTGLCDKYWDSVHPFPEQGDMEQRIGNLTWLLTRATQLLREIPITDATDMRYSTQDHDSALQLSRLIARNPTETTALTEGRLTLEQLENAKRKTPKEFYRRMLDEARDCHQALAIFENIVESRLGIEGPGFAVIKSALSDVTALLTNFARDMGISESPHNSESAIQSASPFLLPDETTLSSRAQALNQLNQVAAFFKHTEPHSPVAYLVEKAVRWSEMPLHAWLRNVVKDPVSLAHLEEMLGVSPQQSPQQWEEK